MTYMTIEQFRQLHEEWKQSGLSVQQYCEDTGLKESRFYYWRSKLKSEPLVYAELQERSAFVNSSAKLLSVTFITLSSAEV